MYRFSLSSFIAFFERHLRNSYKKEDKTQELRMRNLKTSLLSNCFSFIGKSLFKSDRVTFAVYLVHGMGVSEWDEKSWDAFIGRLGGKLHDKSVKYPSWVHHERQEDFLTLYQHCPEIIETLHIENEAWREWVEKVDCENCFPSSIVLSSIERLIMIKTFRPDRLINALRNYCNYELGLDSLTLDTSGLVHAWEETKSTRDPILLITNGGDQGTELKELAEKIVGKQRLVILAKICYLITTIHEVLKSILFINSPYFVSKGLNHYL